MIEIEVIDKQHKEEIIDDWTVNELRQLRDNDKYLKKETKKKMLNRFSKRPRNKPKPPEGEIHKEHEHPNKESWWDKIKSWLSSD